MFEQRPKKECVSCYTDPKTREGKELFIFISIYGKNAYQILSACCALCTDGFL